MLEQDRGLSGKDHTTGKRKRSTASRQCGIEGGEGRLSSADEERARPPRCLRRSE
jgi:hypothetical protein